ncbi:MAG: discoidin domain-containing protein, partial [Melioribacteraceae bacterium]|nr:discoidin domain-containing protein [Melioribacteraceae bacterium]
DKKIDGVNILPVLLGNDNFTPREELWYYYDSDLIAVRKNEWKLFFPSVQRSYEGMEPGMDGFPGPTWQKEIDYALYNLKDDIGEKNNVYEDYPEIVRELESIGKRARFELGDRLTNARGNEIREPGRIGSNRIEYQNNLVTNKKISLTHSANVKYGNGNEKLLIDGWKGSRDYNDGRWLGFEGNDFSALLDLGEEVEISEITISFLQNQMAWIFYPTEVSFSVSKDAQKFTQIKKFSEKINPLLGSMVKDFSFKLQNEKIRFVKIDADNIGICPEWHGGKGGKAWIFADEIQIK